VTDLPDPAGFGLGVLMIAAVLVATIAILWGGYVWLWKSPADRTAERLPSISKRMLHVVVVAPLSVVVALAMGGLAKMGTPGWWVASKLNKPGKDLDLRLFIGTAIVVDSALCFAVLWGGYVLWTRFRFRAHTHRSNQ
jgi:hypothetical protein